CYRVPVPAVSAASALAGGAGFLGGGGGTGGLGGAGADAGAACSAPPNRRMASVAAASAAAVAVSSPVPDADRISPALRSSAANSAGWFTAVPLDTPSRAACAQPATRPATGPS